MDARVMLRALMVLLVLLTAGVAHADNVDALTRDLKSGSDYKIRLSAALSLAKLGDKRAIPAFIVALSDSDKTVRGAAAVGLGKLIDATVPKAQRQQAVAALQRLIDKETSDSVKKQAEKAMQIIQAIDAGTTSSGGSVYIDVGPMSSKAEPAAKLKDLMRKTVQKTFTSKAAGTMTQTWPTGKSPTRKDLDAKKMGGYHVDGTLTDVAVAKKGSSATVSCKVSMLIASFPEKSVFGLLTGGASVTASTDPSDISLATEDCLSAVVEDLVIKKIIPTIKIKAGI